MNASLFIVNRDSKKGFNNLSKTSGQKREIYSEASSRLYGHQLDDFSESCVY